MFVITIKHKDIGPTEYPVYTKNEADSKDITYLHWQQANAKQWALTDDDYVAKVISKKSYQDKDKECPIIIGCLLVILCGILSILIKNFVVGDG